MLLQVLRCGVRGERRIRRVCDAEYVERDRIIKNSMLHTWKKADLLRAIKEAPTADVVEVVRCKDCKNRYVPTRCALWYATVDDKEYFVERGDDFYCSYGAKMDGKG